MPHILGYTHEKRDISQLKFTTLLLILYSLLFVYILKQSILQGRDRAINELAGLGVLY
jgi:hypothetical protein